MSEEVEISSIDLRYEGHRMKNHGVEKKLYESIMEHGIREPLQGVEPKSGLRILLDGFKRLRCACKLKMGMVPYVCVGNDEGMGIIELIRISNQKGLTILEQAALIDELKNVHKMDIGEIASQLERSKAWVCLRAGMIKEMGEVLEREIFSGRFPVYSYMYTLRPFIRVNKIPKKEIEDFVCLLSGKGLSIRDIELLANGYFKGSNEIREHIKEGNISWGLNRLKDVHACADCTEIEQKMLNDLEIVQKYMRRVIFRIKENKLKGNSFLLEANLLTGGILKNLSSFEKELRDFYDRSGKTTSNIFTI